MTIKKVLIFIYEFILFEYLYIPILTCSMNMNYQSRNDNNSVPTQKTFKFQKPVVSKAEVYILPGPLILSPPPHREL